jgi:hypothetical protein
MALAWFPSVRWFQRRAVVHWWSQGRFLASSARPSMRRLLAATTEIVGSALSSESVTLPSRPDRRTDHSQAHSASLSSSTRTPASPLDSRVPGSGARWPTSAARARGSRFRVPQSDQIAWIGAHSSKRVSIRSAGQSPHVSRSVIGADLQLALLRHPPVPFANTGAASVCV